MAAAVIACLRFFQPRRILFLAVSGAFLLGCGFFSLQLTAREDIRTLMPDDDSALAERFAFVRDAPFLHTLAITVGGPDTNPRALADALADALDSAEIPFAAKGPGSFSASDLPRAFALLPALLTPEQIALLAEKLEGKNIREALRHDKRMLLGPSGPALRGLIAHDPLGIREIFLNGIAPMQKMGGIPVRDGYFTDASGAYGLLVVKPAVAMTDAAASARVMRTVREATASLPPGAESLVVGSYRHSADNAAVIKSDLNRVVPVSFLLLAGLFLLFLRNARSLAILAVPLAALCVASAALALVHGSVSGIVLGFGGVVLSITADYAIHTYYAVTRAQTMEQGIIRLCPPLLAGACTTAFAFAALLFSGIPAIRQLGGFALAGIGTALFASLLILPLALRSGGWAGTESPAAKTLRFRPLFATILFSALGLLSIGSFLGLRFDGDIRNLSYLSPETARDEARAGAIWKLPKESSFAVAAAKGTDAGFEQALRINGRVWDLLADSGIPASGLAPFLPSRERQAQSRTAWNDVWAKHGAGVWAELDAAASELGFAPGAFAPFKTWATGDPGEIGPETLRSLGLTFPLAMLANRTAERSLLFTMLPAEYTPETALLRGFQDAGAHYVSGRVFREATAAAVSRDILRFCLLTVAAVILAVFLVFRTPLRCLAVLFPMLTGLTFTLCLFHVAGMAVNMFHAVALPLVITLSVDYGIFMQTVAEGRMDEDGKKGVLLSALTTLAGFGSLLLARHPALFSLGVAVTGGIAAALAAAVWLQPLLFRKGETP